MSKLHSFTLCYKDFAIQNLDCLVLHEKVDHNNFKDIFCFKTYYCKRPQQLINVKQLLFKAIFRLFYIFFGKKRFLNEHYSVNTIIVLLF